MAEIKIFSLWRNQCLCHVDIVSFSVGESGDDIDSVGLRGRYQSVPLRAVQSKGVLDVVLDMACDGKDRKSVV